jgi:hypothetical protein
LQVGQVETWLPVVVVINIFAPAQRQQVVIGGFSSSGKSKARPGLTASFKLSKTISIFQNLGMNQTSRPNTVFRENRTLIL